MIVKEDSQDFQSYLTDASGFSGTAKKLYIPENTEELQNLVKELYVSNQCYTISGAGTGLVGGRVPNDGSVISMEKFDKILEFDGEKGYVIAEAGVSWAKLGSFLEDNGYFLPPNPTEYNSSIGGNVAHNSSGSRSYKYGAIRNFVLELEVILPTGEFLSLQRQNSSQQSKDGKIRFTAENKLIEIETFSLPMPNVKNASGYYIQYHMHLIDLFIGSEGTLGTITKMKFAVSKMPKNLIGFVVYFDNINKLLDFVDFLKFTKSQDWNKSEIELGTDTRALPRLIEFFDTNALKVISEKYPIPKQAKYALWLEQEIEPTVEKTDLSRVEGILLENWSKQIQKYSDLFDYTWVAMTDKEHKEMSEFRHYLPLQIYEKLAKDNQIKIGTDTAVEDKYFREYYMFFTSELLKTKLYSITFGHIGNNHLHINLFCKNEIEKQIALDFYHRLIEKTIKLGGTISAEHGVGKLKKTYFKMMYSEEHIKKMIDIKLKFDPKNLLNRGNIFDINSI